MEFLRLRDVGNCKKFAGSAALAEFCSLWVFQVIDYTVSINCLNLLKSVVVLILIIILFSHESHYVTVKTYI